MKSYTISAPFRGGRKGASPTTSPSPNRAAARPGQARPRLFRLWQQPPARPRLAADYGGTRWYVAQQDEAEDQTLRVLALTTQLLNLQKSAGEIPSSGTLRLVR